MHKKIFIDQEIITRCDQHSDPSLTESLVSFTDQGQSSLVEYSEILKSVILQYPEKLLFNIKEAASALNVSAEFIRKKISLGLIRAVTLGDRKLISVNEIARLIHEGV